MFVKRLGSWAAGLGLCCTGVFAPAAMAVTTGHVGVFSEYVYRGVVANGGAAVQGGIDHVGDKGLLAGVWASNAGAFGGSEFDVYAGYLHKFSDTVMADIGALYYFLPEDEERALIDLDGDGVADREDVDTLELFVTLFAGPIKAQMYWSPDYIGTDEDGFYYSAMYTHKINDTISVAAQVGYTHGDGTDVIYGDEYIDYSLTLSKIIREGLVFSLGFVDTNLKEEGQLFPTNEDDPKVVISAKQTFAF
jgi:uncharacterized protein (TIGR02001 family)